MQFMIQVVRKVCLVNAHILISCENPMIVAWVKKISLPPLSIFMQCFKGYHSWFMA